MAVVPTPHSLSHSAEFNLILKQTQGLRFIGDSLPGGGWMFEALLVLISLAARDRSVCAGRAGTRSR